MTPLSLGRPLLALVMTANEENTEAASIAPETSVQMRPSQRARALLASFKAEVSVYRLVLRHPLTPRLSRILLGIAIAYAISPIDLIPDFIPVLGHVDDVLIVAFLVWAAARTIPRTVLQECRVRVETERSSLPGAAAISNDCMSASRATIANEASGLTTLMCQRAGVQWPEPRAGSRAPAIAGGGRTVPRRV